MTNYNERLDYILRLVFNYGYNEAVVELDPKDIGYDKFKRSTLPDIASKAITSLIKELVVEAKPKTMPSNLSPENYERCEQVVNQYHQNILKGLDEV